jgi:hypothetical protein
MTELLIHDILRLILANIPQSAFVNRQFMAIWAKNARLNGIPYIDKSAMYNYAHRVGSVELIQWCLDIGCDVLQSSSALVRDVSVAKWLHSRNMLFDVDLCYDMKCADIDMVEYIYEIGFRADACEYLVSKNKLDLAEKHVGFSHQLLFYSIKNNKYDFIPYLIEKYSNILPIGMRYSAITNSVAILELLKKNDLLNYVELNRCAGMNIEVYDWCIINNVELNIMTSVVALEYNQLDILKRLYLLGIIPISSITYNIPILKWFHEIKLLVKLRHLYHIIGRIGDIEFLKWYLEFGDWNSEIYMFALLFKNYEFTKYCDKYEYKSNKNIIKYAFRSNYDIFLRYFDEGCVYDNDTLYAVALYDCVNFVKTHMHDKITCDFIDVVFNYGNVKLLNYLADELNYDFSKYITKRMHKKTIIWYIERGFDLNPIYEKILNINSLEVLKMLEGRDILPATLMVSNILDIAVMEYCRCFKWKLEFQVENFGTYRHMVDYSRDYQ